MVFESSVLLFGVIVTTSDAVVVGGRSECRSFVGPWSCRGIILLQRGGTILNVGHPWRLCRQGYSHPWRWYAMLHVGNL